jgi:hypothetical protein
LGFQAQFHGLEGQVEPGVSAGGHVLELRLDLGPTVVALQHAESNRPRPTSAAFFFWERRQSFSGPIFDQTL